MDISVFEETTTMEGVQQFPALLGFNLLTGTNENFYVAESTGLWMLVVFLVLPIVLALCITTSVSATQMLHDGKASTLQRVISGVIALATIVLMVYMSGWFPTEPATHVNGERFHTSRIYVDDEDAARDIDNVRGSWVHINHDLVQEKLHKKDSNLAHYDIQCTDAPEEKERASILCNGDVPKAVTAYKDGSRYTLDPKFSWSRSDGKPVVALRVNVEAH